MNPNSPYLRKDEHGVIRVGTTQVSLEGIVYRFREGYSAEAIRAMYSRLNLDEVYGAIAYYLTNKDEVDRYVDRQEELWEQAKAQSEKSSSPAWQRIKAAANKKAADAA